MINMDFKKKAMEKVKHNKALIKIYRFFGELMINVLKAFISTDNHLILFNSFGGKKYDDSTKAIYELMKNDKRFSAYHLVWAFHEPQKHKEISPKDKIKTDGLKYYITALKAVCWVSNSSIQRGLVFKGKNTLSFNTWHGTPLKDMSLPNGQKNVVMNQCDVILAQSKFEVDSFVKCWKLSRKKYKIFGLPRNDKLAHSNKDTKRMIRNKLGIPEGKFVILYAPTFRDYLLDKNDTCMLEVPFDYSYWEKAFGNDLYFMMRMHYEVSKHNNLPQNNIWHDYSEYPILDDLMIASDLLISDYSSIIFDYAILNKPIVNYIYDYDEYQEKRGLLFDIRKELPYASDSKALAEIIYNLNYEDAISNLNSFREKYVEEYGNATQQSVDYIYNELHNKENNLNRKQ